MARRPGGRTVSTAPGTLLLAAFACLGVGLVCLIGAVVAWRRERS